MWCVHVRRERVRARPALTVRVLGRACSVTQFGWTSLNAASDNGHVEVVQLLIAHGADVDLANGNGWTPLLISCCNGRAKVAKVLLDTKADPLKATVREWGGLPAGSTPLDAAKERGHAACVSLLTAAVEKNPQQAAAKKAAAGGSGDAAPAPAPAARAARKLQVPKVSLS